MFMATGQDIANVAESSAALVYAEVLASGAYYYSITIPALIVATYGGGTGLPTQRGCLELLGCYGSGKYSSSLRSWPRPPCAGRSRSAQPSSRRNG